MLHIAICDDDEKQSAEICRLADSYLSSRPEITADIAVFSCA